MNDKMSPRYQMRLVENVREAIQEYYVFNSDIRFYISKWHEEESNWNNSWENFPIATNANGEIDLLETLHNLDGEILIKIAIDLGIETPDFIPAVPTFRNEIKSSYETASITFEKAFKQIEEHPDIAIGLANSALESIIKEILKDDRITVKLNPNKTLYELTSEVLKVFSLFPYSELPNEIKTIGSSLLAASKNIEKLRSDKTSFHGKTQEDYIINDSLYTYFIFNSIVTLGLFLNSYYKKKFPKVEVEQKAETDDDLPF